VQITQTTNPQGTRPNSTFAVLRAGTGGGNSYSSKGHALDIVGSGLTGTQITILDTAAQNFQTALGRQV
jgi:hypothetical protein